MFDVIPPVLYGILGERAKYLKKLFQTRDKSSHRRCFYKKGSLKNFVKFTEKHLFRSLFLKMLQVLGLQLYY